MYPLSEHGVPASSSFSRTFYTDVIMIYQFAKSDIRNKYLKKKDRECHFLSIHVSVEVDCLRFEDSS